MKKIIILFSLLFSITASATFLGDPTNVGNGGTGLTAIPTSGQMLIGNGTAYTLQSVSGDATVDSSGVLTIGNSAVTNAKMANMSDKTIKSNISGGAAAPSDNTLTALLDNIFGSSQGGILYRGASIWDFLPAGTSGDFLRTNGAGSNPDWATPSGGGSGGVWVGRLTRAGALNCNWLVTSSTPSNFAADADCNTGTAIGSADVTDPGSKVPAITIANVSTSYVYTFKASGFYFSTNSNGEACAFRFSDGTDSAGGNLTYINGGSFLTATGQLDGVIVPTSSGTKTYHIQAWYPFSSRECTLQIPASLQLVIDVFRHPKL